MGNVNYFIEILAVTAVAAAAQAAVGLGFSLLLAPFLQIVGQNINGVRLVNLLALGVNFAILIRSRKGLSLSKALILAIPAVAFSPVGAWLAHIVDKKILSIVVGSIVLTSALILILGLRAPALKGKIGAILAGSSSGLLNAISGVSGPTAALYIANADWDEETRIPTLQLYFLILNATAVALLGWPKLNAGYIWTLFAAVAVGVVIGSLIKNYLPSKATQYGILTVAAVGGIIVIIG